MGHVRLLPVIALTILATTCGIAALLLSTHHGQKDSRSHAEVLSDVLEFKSTYQRGLTPCDRQARDIAERARSNLLKLGEPHARLVAVVAPTFSGPVIVSLDHGVVRRYQYPGQAGFGPYWDWFSSEPELLADVRLSDQHFSQVLASLERHATHAMTVRDTGYDGIPYFISLSGGVCASASPFRSRGPAALIGQLLYEVTADSPSESQLIALANAIDQVDLLTQPPAEVDDDLP